MGDTCQAPCKPRCPKPKGENAPVVHAGAELRVCSGHHARWRRAETDAERAEALATPLRSGPAMVKFPSLRVPPELDRDVRAAAQADGAELNEVGREALEQWLERRAKRKA